MFKPVYFNEFECPDHKVQGNKGRLVRDRIIAIGAFALLVAGDVLTSLI